MAAIEIEYCRIGPNLKDTITDVLMDIYMKTEMIARNLNIDGRTDGRPFVDEVVKKSLRDRVSMVAVDKQHGKIVGFMLNTIEEKAACAQETEGKLSESNDKMNAMYNVLWQVSENVDYFERFKVTKVFYFCVLCVLPRYQGCGIAKSLVSQSIQIWKETGIPLSRVETTGFISRRIFESFGFDLYQEKRYDEIVLEGKPFVVDEQVNPTLSIWTKRILKSS